MAKEQDSIQKWGGYVNIVILYQIRKILHEENTHNLKFSTSCCTTQSLLRWFVNQASYERK